MLVDSVDYPNRRIFLSALTVGVDINVIDIYIEMRERRRLNADNDREFLPMLTAQGNEPAGPTNTPRRVVLRDQARIVPFDISHVLSITPVPLVSIDESLAGVDLFDRSTLSPGVEVDINYQPQAVEIITVPTGGTTQQEIRDAMELPSTSGQIPVDVKLNNNGALAAGLYGKP